MLPFLAKHVVHDANGDDEEDRMWPELAARARAFDAAQTKGKYAYLAYFARAEFVRLGLQAAGKRRAAGHVRGQVRGAALAVGALAAALRRASRRASRRAPGQAPRRAS